MNRKPKSHRSKSCGRKPTRVAERRLSSTKRGYGRDWQKLRRIHLEKHPLCAIQVHCRGAVAQEVDHIEPIEIKPDLRLEPSNLQSACKQCHSWKTRVVDMPKIRAFRKRRQALRNMRKHERRGEGGGVCDADSLETAPTPIF